MTSTAVVQRYAQALYQESAQARQVQDDVALMTRTLEDSRDLRLCMASPVIPRAQKASVVNRLFAPHVHPLTLKFLQLLVKREREDLLSAILNQFQAFSDHEQGIINVHAQVAAPLNEEARAQLMSTLEDRLGRSVRLSVALDSELIGGIILRIGDTVYDGSVRYQLSMLRKRMHV